MNEPQITQPIAPTPRRYSPALIVIIVLSVLMSAALGTAAYITRSTYLQTHTQLLRERLVQTTATTLSYGRVESVHLADNALIVVALNRFSPTDEPRRILVRVLPETTIARQDLYGERGLYYFLSARTPASLESIEPGMNIAFLLENRSKTKDTIARILLFGNPL